ncbi:MAG: hypothetical protein KBA46_04455 [Candidatus Omnitrophica bacterium]|nr:hypothetical protein [Candidatus Omnitrophota bacterium]
MDKKTGSILLKTVILSLSSIRRNKILLAPFVLGAFFQISALVVLYLIPRAPLKTVLGPPIRTLWGEKFLHYPANFILLPKLSAYANVVLSIIIGSFLTAVAVLMAQAVYQKKQIKLKPITKTALRSYIQVFFVVFLFNLVFFLLQKLLSSGLLSYFLQGHRTFLFLGPTVWLGPLWIGINFVLALCIQAVFMYAIPFLLIGKKPLLQAIIHSCLFTKRYLLQTLLLIGIPLLLFLPFQILISNTAFLINKLFPEFIFLLSLAAIVFSALVVDAFTSLATAFFYLGVVDREKNS